MQWVFYKGRYAHKALQCDESGPECKKCTTSGYSCNYDQRVPDLQMLFRGASVIKAPRESQRSVDQGHVRAINVPARLSPAITSDSNLTFHLDRQSLDRLARFQTRTVFCIGTPSSVKILQNVAIGLACSVSVFVNCSCTSFNWCILYVATISHARHSGHHSNP